MNDLAGRRSDSPRREKRVRRPHRAATTVKPPQPAPDGRTPRQGADRVSTESRPALRPTPRKQRRMPSDYAANPTPEAEGSRARNAATENQPDRPWPHGPARHRSPRLPRNAAKPGQFRYRSDAVREASRQRRINAPPPTLPRWYATTPRSRPRHPRRSQPVSLRTHHLGRRHSRIDRGSLSQAGAQFRNRGLTGHPAHCVKEVARQRQARQRRTGFKQAMKRLRHIANLDHRGHGKMMGACAAHVKPMSGHASAANPAPPRAPPL